MTTSARRKQGVADYDRRIVYAVLVSILLHLPLLLPSGSWQFGAPGESTGSTPELKVELLEPGDAAAETPKAAEMEPEAVANEALPSEAIDPSDGRENAEELLAQTDTDTEMRSAQTIDESSPTEQPSDVPPSFAALESEIIGSQLAQISQDGALDAIALEEPAYTDEPVVAADAPAQAIAPAQQLAMTRRLVQEARHLLTSGASERAVTFESRNREFSAVLTRAPAEDGTGIERITADITTDHGGQRARTSLQLKRLSFSHFTQLVDKWDPGVALHDDEIDGRFHSNTEIQVVHDRRVAPRMHGKVTTARGVHVREEGRWTRSMRKIFLGGLETRTERVRLPKMALPIGIGADPGAADLHIVRGDTLIVFHSDGAYECIDAASRVRRKLAPGKPTYIVGVLERELRVRGVVNGNVTVYSPERIVIQGSITYAHGARPDGDAYLGLVSDGNVEIAPPEVTGPGNLDIHAAIYARERFVVRDTSGRRGAKMSIYGSLTAGSISATEPRYATRTEFDPRFERTRPPGFPETERYEVEGWDGQWRVAEGPTVEQSTR